MREKLIELLAKAEDEYLEVASIMPLREIKEFMAEMGCYGFYADHLIANGVTIATDNNKWIPVTERLPEKPGDYLCRVLWDGGYQGKKIHVVYYCGHNEWLLNRTDAVTHWMPLPEPPKGE